MTSARPAAFGMLALAAASWPVVVRQMQGRDTGVATTLGSFGLFLALGLSMILTGAVPAAIRQARARGRTPKPPLVPVGQPTQGTTARPPDMDAEPKALRPRFTTLSRLRYRAEASKRPMVRPCLQPIQKTRSSSPSRTRTTRPRATPQAATSSTSRATCSSSASSNPRGDRRRSAQLLRGARSCGECTTRSANLR